MKRIVLAAIAGLALGWAAAMPAQAGGSIVITYKDDVSTLDPAIGYDWQNWSIIKSLFDGLMDYKPGTTELVPALAESYTITNDGKTFTFKLRPGVKFHMAAKSSPTTSSTRSSACWIRRRRARAPASSARSPR